MMWKIINSVLGNSHPESQAQAQNKRVWNQIADGRRNTWVKKSQVWQLKGQESRYRGSVSNAMWRAWLMAENRLMLLLLLPFPFPLQLGFSPPIWVAEVESPLEVPPWINLPILLKLLLLEPIFQSLSGIKSKVTSSIGI